MINIYNIYKKLPYFLQFLVFNIKAFLIFRRRFNKSSTKKIYRQVVNENKLNKYQIFENLNQKLKIFFLEANNTKFWKKQFEIFSINLEADNFIDELSKLPILTKDQVKKYYKEIVNKKYISKSKNYNTSGTTGS